MTAHAPSQRTGRARRLNELFESSLLSKHFTRSEELEPDYDDFTKLKVAENGLGILSFEIYTHARRPETLRVHHKPSTPEEFRQKLPGAMLSPTVGVNFEGDLVAAARGICEEVERWNSSRSTLA